MTENIIDLRFKRELRRNGTAKVRKKAKPQYFAMYEFDGAVCSIRLFARSEQDAARRIGAMRQSLRMPAASDFR